MTAPILALALLAAPVSPPAAPVQVTIGPELEAKAARYGPREIEELRADLAKTVASAAARGGFTRVELTLEDARPNRPTPAMLSREPQLSLTSISVGGAKISGVAYGPSGAQPLKSGWYETLLRNEFGPSTWSDADRAFQHLAADLAKGRAPDAYGPTVPGPEGPPSDWRDPWTRDD